MNLSLPAPDPISFLPSFCIFQPSGHLLMVKSAFCCLSPEKQQWQRALTEKKLPLVAAALRRWEALEQLLVAPVCFLSHSPHYCKCTPSQKPLSSQNQTYWHTPSPATGHSRFWNLKKSSLLVNALFPLLDESTFKLCPKEVLKIRYGEIHAGHSPSVPPPSQTAGTKLSVTTMIGKYIYTNSADSKVIIDDWVQRVVSCFVNSWFSGPWMPASFIDSEIIFNSHVHQNHKIYCAFSASKLRKKNRWWVAELSKAQHK